MRLIGTDKIDQFCALKPGQGLAQVRVDEIRGLGLDVQQETEAEWGEFADAHAVLVGYGQWPNNRKEDAARALRDAVNLRGLLRIPNG